MAPPRDRDKHQRYLPVHLRLLFTLAKEKKEGHRIRLQRATCSGAT
jgi:hypothetical protein